MAYSIYYTNYYGNWRGVALVNDTNLYPGFVSFIARMSIQRKGTGTLVDQTFYWLVGSTVDGEHDTIYDSGSKKINSSQWTEEDQRIDIFNGIIHIPRTNEDQRVKMRFGFRYGGEENEFHYTQTSFYIDIPKKEIATTSVNVDGAWKTGEIYVNAGGTWYPADSLSVNVDGTWKDAQ